MEIIRVNEDNPDANYVIEVLDPVASKWMYITTEFSSSVAITVASNLWIVTPPKM